MAAEIARGTDLLNAGAARCEITPQQHVTLAGEVGWHRPATSIADPLFARALIFERGAMRLCFISLDVTIVTEPLATRIRQAVADEHAIPIEAVMVHATQVHAAPALGHFGFDPEFPNLPEDMEWLAGAETHYFDFAVERILLAVREAVAKLRPCRLRLGSAIEGRVQFNRRAVTDSGRVRMPGPCWPEPLGPTYIRYMEGPIDPEVGVLCVQDDSDEMLALLLHHTCHPVNVFPQPVISADWPGAWVAEMEARHVPNCVALVANGCCGNINPWNPFDPDYRPDHLRMGRILAETAQKIIDTLEFEADTTLSYQSRKIALPFREVEPELLAGARAMLEAHPQPVWNSAKAYTGYEGGSPLAAETRVVDSDWMKAASVMSVHLQRERERALHYEIQAFRIGRAALAGLPGEPFVEGQLRIKMSSPAHLTFIAHCCNMYCGYLPTREAFPRGGHEVETRYWSKLIPDALDTVVQETVRLIDELFTP